MLPRRLPRRPMALGAVCILLAACAASADSGMPSPSATPTSHGDAPASAAPAPPSASPAVLPVIKEQPLVDVGGDVRRVDLYVPEAVAAAGELMPLLVLLHGNNESPQRMIIASKADRLAASEGVIVALPPARDRRWRALVPDGEAVTDSPDIGYVTGLIDQLVATRPVDPERVYVGGFSMGATLAGRLACQAAGRVAGVVINAGTEWSSSCQPAAPVSVLVVHGSADNVFSVEAARLMAETWRHRNGCDDAGGTVDLGEGVTSWLAAGCRDGTAVQYVEVDNGTHRWFGDPDTTTLAWEFLSANNRR